MDPELGTKTCLPRSGNPLAPGTQRVVVIARSLSSATRVWAEDIRPQTTIHVKPNPLLVATYEFQDEMGGPQRLRGVGAATVYLVGNYVDSQGWEYVREWLHRMRATQPALCVIETTGIQPPSPYYI